LRPLRAPHLDSLRSPFGPACGCYCASLRFFACPRKVCQRRAPRHPGFATRNLIRFAHPAGQPAAVTPLRCVSSLRCRSGGRLTWAVPGPLSLSPHPCGSLPYATPPLGLLKGTGSRACVIFAKLKLAASVPCLCSSTSMVQTTPKSPSGGRVESPRKGLSDMDVARAAMGQGWPFAACPWSGDGAREPRRSRGRMVGCPSLWLLSLGQARESDSPVRGETHQARRRANG
jgi:hypothetical protein